MMDKDRLNRILNLHAKWLNGQKCGYRADLSYADLKNANLNGANLIYANLDSADLSYADLRHANLNSANLNGANLIYANLDSADLSYANLNGANLNSANLNGADLSYANLNGANLNHDILDSADLSYADLRHANLNSANLNSANLNGANLNGANLSNAKLKGVYADETTAFFHLQCPEEGSYIAYKKCQNNMIVKLLIPEDAKRSSATTRKCRASKAKVLSITNINGTENFEEAISCHNPNFIYKIGEIVEVEDFDEDRWNECSTGIHHFITRDEAVNYDA